MKALLCYCGSNKSYSACCSLAIDAREAPASPEALMRSRYSAYAQANIAYIINTMCGQAALDFDADEAREWATRVEWLGLSVIKARYHRSDSNRAMVEFIACYRDNGIDRRLHEKSEFIRKNGRWFYACGEII